MKSSIRSIVPKYKVRVHRKVSDFVENEIREPERQEEVRRLINDLPDYPSVLERWDIEKVKGRENTYRVRIGRHRIAFIVDKANRQINVLQAVTK